MASEQIDNIRALIRDIPDYPKKGIIFKDITPLLSSDTMFKRAVEEMAMRLKTMGVQKIVGIESRGFIFGAPLALRLGVGFIPIRKKGKLPAKTRSITYALEYGQDSLEVHEDALTKGMRVAVVDDVLATGGTAAATCSLIEQCGGVVAGVAFLIELGFLNGKEKLNKYKVESLVTY